jgi:hypothetical protein
MPNRSLAKLSMGPQGSGNTCTRTSMMWNASIRHWGSFSPSIASQIP